MPDETQSETLRKFRTSFPHARFELQTLQLQQRRLNVAEELDIVFVMDTTGSMSASLETVADSLAGVASGIASEYTSVRYAVIDFKDEDETAITTGADFVDIATAQTALDGLAASGGGDDPETDSGRSILLQKCLGGRKLQRLSSSFQTLGAMRGEKPIRLAKLNCFARIVFFFRDQSQ